MLSQITVLRLENDKLDRELREARKALRHAPPQPQAHAQASSQIEPVATPLVESTDAHLLPEPNVSAIKPVSLTKTAPVAVELGALSKLHDKAAPVAKENMPGNAASFQKNQRTEPVNSKPPGTTGRAAQTRRPLGVL